MPELARSSGVLLHVSSLSAPHGVGDLGPASRRFVETLVRMAQSWWQVLPLAPTSIGDSPYFSPSAMAGNPLLISLEDLAGQGWLEPDEWPPLPESDRTDYGAARALKEAAIASAFERFEATASDDQAASFASYSRAQAPWLDDDARFAAIKAEQGGRPWTEWPAGLARRDPTAMARSDQRLARAMARHRFAQWLFETQMSALRAYAHSRGVGLIGDIPLFVAHDSADVWRFPQGWQLDEAGRPRVVAGVPPDYFSATGQLWGNPHYDWERMAADDYAWWRGRFAQLLRWVDWVRLDHFRGFAGYWEVPAGEPTAEHGRWVPGPGARFFDVVRARLGELPILAEDLGVITPDVVALRERYGLPGMKILQFAFDSREGHAFFPHGFSRRCVVYTGTHDNDTSLGWYEAASPADRALMADYLGHDPSDEPHWELIRLGWASVADLAVVPVQDLLGLDSSARMNRPGTAMGNWSWRLRAHQLTPEVVERLARLTRLYERDRRV